MVFYSLPLWYERLYKSTDLAEIKGKDYSHQNIYEHAVL